jgi:hypothetical protein
MRGTLADVRHENPLDRALNSSEILNDVRGCGGPPAVSQLAQASRCVELAAATTRVGSLVHGQCLRQPTSSKNNAALPVALSASPGSPQLLNG